MMRLEKPDEITIHLKEIDKKLEPLFEGLKLFSTDVNTYLPHKYHITFHLIEISINELKCGTDIDNNKL